MIPEVRRLQILNDLIAQTLDAINQRQVAGLSFGAYAPELGFQMNPLQMGSAYGLQHSPAGFIPAVIPTHLGLGTPFVGVTPQLGLSHTPVAPVGALSLQPGLGQGVTGSYAAPGVAGMTQARSIWGNPFAYPVPVIW